MCNAYVKLLLLIIDYQVNKTGPLKTLMYSINLIMGQVSTLYFIVFISYYNHFSKSLLLVNRAVPLNFIAVLG